MQLVRSIILALGLSLTVWKHVQAEMSPFTEGVEWPISLNVSCQKLGTAVACSFDLINKNDKEDYYILKRGTPLEGLLSPFVSVHYKANYPLQYQGIHVHRSPPERDEFILLRSGKSVSASVAINNAFEFSKDGLYTVTYINPLQYISKTSMELESSEYQLIQSQVRKSFSINLDDVAASISKPFKEENEGRLIDLVRIEGCGSAGFIGGSRLQKNDITKAHSQLCKHYKVAKSKIKDTHLYETWFGEYTPLRAKHVAEVILKCMEGLEGNAITYRINPSMCRYNWNAFTYTSTKIFIYILHAMYMQKCIGSIILLFNYYYYLTFSIDSNSVSLCPAYHQYNIHCKRHGLPTKESILAHEWTHAFGWTRDFVYGEKRTKELAKKNPWKAIMNADSYEFFYCISQF